MDVYPISPARTLAIADEASDAVRGLNHATHPADGFPGLEYPANAYYLLGVLSQLASRVPQLIEQISAFLQCQLQHNVIAIDDGQYRDDPLAAVGTASHLLEGQAATAARHLADALTTAQQAIAFARYTGPDRNDQ